MHWKISIFKIKCEIMFKNRISIYRYNIKIIAKFNVIA